jgi:NTP pyrophosphatase (non-canonical NTP hydrolase)
MSSSLIYNHTVHRTYNSADNFGPQDTLHAILGLIGEAGELADAIKKHQFYGLPLDVDNIREELGDIGYYFSALHTCFGLDEQEIAYQNRNKLMKRYPEGFTSEAAAFRADKIQ